MNKHFEDARYYLLRALENANRGVRSELEPIERRVRELTGREAEPEPGRTERIRNELHALRTTAEAAVDEATGKTRARLNAFRGKAN